MSIQPNLRISLRGAAQTTFEVLRIFRLPLFGIVCLGLIHCSTTQNKSKTSLIETRKDGSRVLVLPDDDFLEMKYMAYHRRYPLVPREAYMERAKNQLHNFCLFRKNPAKECADFGNYEYTHGRSQSAEAAYLAAALTEKYHSNQRNIKIFGALTQIALEKKDKYSAQIYIAKILSINGHNKWAKDKLLTVLYDN